MFIWSNIEFKQLFTIYNSVYIKPNTVFSISMFTNRVMYFIFDTSRQTQSFERAAEQGSGTVKPTDTTTFIMITSP